MKNKKLNQFLDKIHQIFSKNKIFVEILLKIRNQCNAIIKYSLGESCHHSINGELWLIQNIVPTANTIIDVGANIGDWSSLCLELMKPSAKLICFEPAPTTFSELEKNISDDARVELIQSAVGDNDGKVIFFEAENSSPLSSCVEKNTLELNLKLTKSEVKILKLEVLWEWWC